MTIKIKEDKSYLSEIDLLSVEKGVAELGIHSIRLNVEFTDEQKQENIKAADSLSRDEWSNRCEKSKNKQAEKIKKVIDAINENFKIYQYKDDSLNYSGDNWDLYFWCNSGDMSYVTLSPNKKRVNEQQIKDINNVLEFIKTLDSEEGVNLNIQYTAIYDVEKVENIVNDVFTKVKDQFISYMGSKGKIKEVGTSHTGSTVYGFFKKRARSNYYKVSKDWFLQTAFNN